MKTKTKKGNVAVMAIIVVIVAITAGLVGYLFARQSQVPLINSQQVANVPAQATQNAPMQSDTPKTTSQATSQKDQTANWQTYTDARNGFTFKYPKTWKIGEENEYGVSLTSDDANSMLATDAFIVSYDPTIKTLNAYYKTQAGSLVEKNGTTTIIDGKKADEVTMPGSLAHFGLLIENNGIYIIEFSLVDSKEHLGNVQKTILSTFKFIN